MKGIGYTYQGFEYYRVGSFWRCEKAGVRLEQKFGTKTEVKHFIDLQHDRAKKLSPAEEGEASARRDCFEPKPDDLNPVYLFQTTVTGLLIRCAGGDFDLVQMAKDELARRGLDLDGKWVGFKGLK